MNMQNLAALAAIASNGNGIPSMDLDDLRVDATHKIYGICF